MKPSMQWMSTFRGKVLAAGVAASVIAVGMVAPAVTGDATAALNEPQSEVCGALAGDLQAGPTDALGSLTGVPPDPTKAADILWKVLGTANALQSTECLPAIPPAPGTDPTECLPLNLDLLSALLGVLSTLTSASGGGLPDVTGAVSGVQKLLTTITGLTDAECLPAAPV